MKKVDVFIICLLLVAGCAKDKTENTINYSTSSVIANNLLPTQGGCIDHDGNLITFSPPTFEDNWPNVGDFILPPSFKKFNSNGQLIQEITLPPVKAQYYYGSAEVDTINEVPQFRTDNLKVTLAINKAGAIINSNSIGSSISKYSGGTNDFIVQLRGVVSIAIDADDMIYALTSPVYDNNLNLLKAPEVFKINSNGDVSSFFTFPTTYAYPYGNLAGNGQGNYPMDNPDDIAIGTDGSLYIAIGVTSRTFKISKSGIAEEITNDIPMPTSIATDKFGDIFIASAPVFDSMGHVCSKPAEVIEIMPNKSRKTIYSGSSSYRFFGGMYTNVVPGKYVAEGCNMNISIGPNGDLFLEEPLNAQIIRIY